VQPLYYRRARVETLLNLIFRVDQAINFLAVIGLKNGEPAIVPINATPEDRLNPKRSLQRHEALFEPSDLP
jgi:hypothetical protein